ncbi:LRR receptor-like serine threonine-protein kinase [Seminavis robusta]|uniref:LRR receptor-like serine threonine-protein kinase n=1 Tax=Seminavis robusta TaxID=568900 RepID=A0A9N8H6L7_9STRA|nr:LRR receptor-like serine threonine-protein kinase [Seminavis robusta]|eukprot:Sro103_g052540.1 LRR receptor-like serine threonine-protein kinase (770) ;mRNA; r:74428-76833
MNKDSTECKQHAEASPLRKGGSFEEEKEEMASDEVGASSLPVPPTRVGAFPGSRTAYKERKKASKSSATSSVASIDSTKSAMKTKTGRGLRKKQSKDQKGVRSDSDNAVPGTAVAVEGIRSVGDVSAPGTAAAGARSDSDMFVPGTAVDVAKTADNSSVTLNGEDPATGQDALKMEASESGGSQKRQEADDNTLDDEKDYPHLLEAVAVEELELAVAIQVDSEDPQRRTLWIAVGICFVLITIGIAVGIWAGVSANKPTEDPSLMPSPAPSSSSSPSQAPSQHPSYSAAPSTSPSSHPSGSPSQSPTEVSFFLPEYTQRTISLDTNGTTPQAKAMDWILLHPQFSTLPQWQRRQLFALATMYYSTSGDVWGNQQTFWLRNDVSECFWNGENQCDGSGRVSALKLNELSGSLPPEISLLASLSTLTVSPGGLSGPLPTEIGLFASLATLDLSLNRISGSIPSEVGSMLNLTGLMLGENNFQDTLPSTLQGMTSLEELNLEGNNLSGSILSELGLMTSLRLLSLGSNNLTDVVPSELGLLSRLKELSLERNILSGRLPSQLGRLELLTRLDIHSNPRLEGTIPLPWVGMISMENLNLLNNALSGTVPKGMCAIRPISIIRVDCNVNCTCAECSCLHEVVVEGTFEFGLFPEATIRPPTGSEIDGLMNETRRFYTNLFRGAIDEFPSFASIEAEFVGFRFEETADLPYQIDADVTAKFRSEYGIRLPSTLDAFDLMQAAIYLDYIINYVWKATPPKGIFVLTQECSFAARVA